MKKVFMLAILVSFLISGIVYAGDSTLGETLLEKAFKDGKFKGKFGFYAEGKDPDIGQSGNLLTSFAELGFLSGSLNGLQFGLKLYGVTDLDDDELARLGLPVAPPEPAGGEAVPSES